MSLEHKSSIARAIRRSPKILCLEKRTLVTLEEIYWALRIMIRKDYRLSPVPLWSFTNVQTLLRDIERQR